MKNKLNKILLIVIVMLAVILISFIGFHSADTPVLKDMKSYKITSYENGVFKGNANFLIENTNWYKIYCKKIDFQLVYNGHQFATGYLKESTTLPSRGEAILPIEFSFSIDSLKEDLSDLLMKDSIKITEIISGKFTKLNFSVDKSSDVWIKPNEILGTALENSGKKDAAKFKSINILKFTPAITTLSMNFEVANSFPVDIYLNKMDIAIFSDKNFSDKVATWVNNDKQLIAKDSSQTINAIADIDNFKTGLSGLSKMLSGSLDYYVKGYSIISIDKREIKIPITQHFLVNPLTREITILKN